MRFARVALLAVRLLAPSPTAATDAAAVAVPAAPGTAHAHDSAPALREFHLTAQEARWEVQPGTTIDGWTYNGQVPGPELRVREGDRVRVTLTNRLPVPTTIHWHGVELDNAMDGVPGLTQDAVAPGGEFTYEFVATPAGTRWYHSHQDPADQLELGLYGALIIEPREPAPVHYDREYTYLLDELALDFTPQVARGLVPYPGQRRGGVLPYDLFLLNGKAGAAVPPLELARGDRVLIRLINAGNLVHSMHLHGHTMRVVATDGNPVPREGQWRKDTVTLGPGERVDLEVVGEHPGIWMFHCHMPNHSANGMMALVVYADATPAVPAAAGHQHDGAHQAPTTVTTAVPATPAAAAASPPAPTATPTPTPAPPSGTPTPGATPTTAPPLPASVPPATTSTRRRSSGSRAAPRWCGSTRAATGIPSPVTRDAGSHRCSARGSRSR